MNVGERSASEELRAIRAVLARRRRGGADPEAAGDASDGAAYRAYLVVMVLIAVVAPVLRAAAVWFGDAWPAVGADGPRFLAAGAFALLAALALFGAQRGPAAASLPRIDLVLTGPLERSRALRSTVLRSFFAATALGLVAAGVFALGALPPAAWGIAACTGAALGLLGATVLLLGQLGRGLRAGLAGSCTALALVAFAVPGGGTGTTDGIDTMGSPIPTLLVAGVPLALGLAGLLAAPGLAARVPLGTLREQAGRFDDVTILALSGDPAIAAARLGAPVRVGRHWRLSPGSRPVAAILARDLLGLLRAPLRSVLAVIVAVAAGAILVSAVDAGGLGLAAVAGALCGALLYAALGACCRGLRATGEGIGGPALLPLSPGRLLGLHAILPALLACGSVLLGTVLGEGSSIALLCGAALALLTVLLRVLAVLKGTLPQRLLAPIPTAAGDLSALNVLVWTLDGPILAAIVGALLAALTAGAPNALLPVVVAFLGLLVLWARRRYRAARGVS